MRNKEGYKEEEIVILTDILLTYREVILTEGYENVAKNITRIESLFNKLHKKKRSEDYV